MAPGNALLSKPTPCPQVIHKVGRQTPDPCTCPITRRLFVVASCSLLFLLCPSIGAFCRSPACTQDCCLCLFHLLANLWGHCSQVTFMHTLTVMLEVAGPSSVPVIQVTTVMLWVLEVGGIRNNTPISAYPASQLNAPIFRGRIRQASLALYSIRYVPSVYILLGAYRNTPRNTDPDIYISAAPEV